MLKDEKFKRRSGDRLIHVFPIYAGNAPLFREFPNYPSNPLAITIL